MTAVYDPVMPMNVAEVAAYLQVSEDTVRALIRAQHLPAKQERPRGGYTVEEADAARVKVDRAAGRLAGPVQLTAEQLAEAAARQAAYLEALDRADELLDERDAYIRWVRESTGAGYGAVTTLADELDMHRTAVQRIAGSEPKPRESRAARYAEHLRARHANR